MLLVAVVVLALVPVLALVLPSRGWTRTNCCCCMRSRSRRSRGPSSLRRQGPIYRLTAEPCDLSSQEPSKRYGVGRTTVLAASVTAPIRASALPLSVAPVSRVID